MSVENAQELMTGPEEEACGGRDSCAVPALLDRVRELEAERDEGLTFVRKWSKANARWRRLARGTIRKLTAERDAALSTIAKVREILAHDEIEGWEHDEWVYRQEGDRKLSEIEDALWSVPSTGEGNE